MNLISVIVGASGDSKLAYRSGAVYVYEKSAKG
jgi:hypothetical protein